VENIHTQIVRYEDGSPRPWRRGATKGNPGAADGDVVHSGPVFIRRSSWTARPANCSCPGPWPSLLHDRRYLLPAIRAVMCVWLLKAIPERAAAKQVPGSSRGLQDPLRGRYCPGVQYRGSSWKLTSFLAIGMVIVRVHEPATAVFSAQTRGSSSWNQGSDRHADPERTRNSLRKRTRALKDGARAGNAKRPSARRMFPRTTRSRRFTRGPAAGRGGFFGHYPTALISRKPLAA